MRTYVRTDVRTYVRTYVHTTHAYQTYHAYHAYQTYHAYHAYIQTYVYIFTYYIYIYTYSNLNPWQYTPFWCWNLEKNHQTLAVRSSGVLVSWCTSPVAQRCHKLLRCDRGLLMIGITKWVVVLSHIIIVLCHIIWFSHFFFFKYISSRARSPCSLLGSADYCISFNPIFSRLLSHIISHIIRLYYHLSILGTFFQGRSDRGQVTGVKSRWLSVLVFFGVQLGFFSITTLFRGIKWYKDGNNLHKLDISPTTMVRKTSEKTSNKPLIVVPLQWT